MPLFERTVEPEDDKTLTRVLKKFWEPDKISDAHPGIPLIIKANM